MALPAEKILKIKSEALAFLTSKQYRSALPLLEILLQEKQELLFTYNALAVIHKEFNVFDKALYFYQLALDIAPEEAFLYNNIGNLYRKTEQYALSLRYHQKAIQLEPNNAAILTNFAASYSDITEFEKALPLLNKAIGISPNYAEAQLNSAIILLRNGDFKNGFERYEHRWQIDNKPKLHLTFGKRWSGEPIKGKRIVIFREQGFGDMLHFIRYAPLLKSQGAIVFLLCQNELMPLLKQMNCFEKIVCDQNDLPEFDYAVPVLSLPFRFQTTVDSIPSFTPYISVDINKHLLPETLVQKNGKRKIGFCWTGKSTQNRNHFRSCSFDNFKRLFSVPNTEWFSLQLGDKENHLRDDKLPDNVFDAAPFIHDFSDTAAIIQHLDLVISIDTAVVHLCGALNKPGWVCIDTVCDWRWLLNRNDSPWYPSLKLFRQTTLHDWNAVFERVYSELEENDVIKAPTSPFPKHHF